MGFLEVLKEGKIACRKPPEVYYPSFDLRGLSTVEELEWATGMDVTGGKEFELNVFDRDRLRDCMVRPPLFAHMPCILFWCLLLQCSSRDKQDCFHGCWKWKRTTGVTA